MLLCNYEGVLAGVAKKVQEKYPHAEVFLDLSNMPSVTLVIRDDLETDIRLRSDEEHDGCEGSEVYDEFDGTVFGATVDGILEELDDQGYFDLL